MSCVVSKGTLKDHLSVMISWYRDKYKENQSVLVIYFSSRLISLKNSLALLTNFETFLEGLITSFCDI